MTPGRATPTRPAHWRDNHYRVAGPVVAELQASFMDHWMRMTGKVLHGVDYFPALLPVTPVGAMRRRSAAAPGRGARKTLN